jgi:hypothetical protein
VATTTFTAGQRLTANFMRLAYPMGVIAQGIRTSNKAFTTTETGYLRLDDVDLIDGRAYMIVAQNLRVAIAGTRTANDHAKFVVRYDGTGAAATTSSTEIGRSENSTGTPTVQNDSFPPAIGWVLPTADVTGSFLLSAIETNSTTATYEVQADPGGVLLTVFDMGIAVADSGVDV